MRCLVGTHHLHNWAGSETVTREIVADLHARGFDVSVFCPFVDFRMCRAHFDPAVPIIFDPALIELADYDLVIANHQTPSRFLPFQTDEALFGAARPVFVYNHMSPFEPFEQPGPFVQAHFADIVLCNSPETRSTLFGRAGAGRHSAHLFANPAPAAFERAGGVSGQGTLTRLLCVSNHVPSELGRALDILRARGVSVTHLGAPNSNRVVTPEDIWAHDAVITIGKTVQYALRARVPVFCYDMFQGPGWLSAENFTRAAATNFSGRCSGQARTAEELADEVLHGFADAQQFALGPQDEKLPQFHLERQMDKLLDRVRQMRRDRIATPLAISPRMRNKIRQQIVRDAALYKLVDREYANANRKNRKITKIETKVAADGIVPVKTNLIRSPPPGKAMVIALFAFRYDRHLVPALLENLSPFVHGWAVWDDRQAKEKFTGDAERQSALFKAARDMGADWVLATDPDERFEHGLTGKMESLVNENGPVCWVFSCREMYSPMAYRNDGLWGAKDRMRLFPCLPGMEPDKADLHGHWTCNSLKLPVRHTGLSFYHLRMATPERRQHRRDLYAAADPQRARQGVGYDYLVDERGIELVEIPDERRYTPVHVEDHGLWAPDIAAVGPVRPDSPKHRQNWAYAQLEAGGRDAAFAVLTELAADPKAPAELAFCATDLASDADQRATVLPLLQRLGEEGAQGAYARFVESGVRAEVGEGANASQLAQAALAQYPDSPTLQRQAQASLPVPDRFVRSQALWRRWCTSAKLYEGRDVAQNAGLAAVVLALRAPVSLVQAVQSLCDQDVDTEIVVVNSGGGDVLDRLRPYLDRIRLIDVKERLFPGAARNVGIDASSAPYVAFLASDCITQPGWSAGRLQAHEAGAHAVSSAVINAAPENRYSLLASAHLHRTRWPTAKSDRRRDYGLSYSRSIFHRGAYFPTGLRVGEDSFVNTRLPEWVRLDWRPDVQVAHAYPTSFWGLLSDMVSRGYHRAGHSPFNEMPVRELFGGFLWTWLRSKNQQTHRALIEEVVPEPRKLGRIVFVLRVVSRGEAVGMLWSRTRRALVQRLMTRGQGVAHRDPSLATTLLSKAAAQAPQNLDAQIILAHHLDAHRDTAPPEALCRVLQAAISLAPDKVDLHKWLAAEYSRTGQHKAAFDVMDRACQIVPMQTALWWERWRLAIAADHLFEAYVSLQHLLSCKPGNADLLQKISALKDQLDRENSPKRAAE